MIDSLREALRTGGKDEALDDVDYGGAAPALAATLMFGRGTPVDPVVCTVLADDSPVIGWRNGTCWVFTQFREWLLGLRCRAGAYLRPGSIFAVLSSRG
jgi:hypothetical protein